MLLRVFSMGLNFSPWGKTENPLLINCTLPVPKQRTACSSCTLIPKYISTSTADSFVLTYCKPNRPHPNTSSHLQLLLASPERTTGAPTYCRHDRPHPHIHSHLQLLLASAEKSTDCTYLLQAQQTTPPYSLPPPTALGISWKVNRLHLPTAGTTDHTPIFTPTPNCSWHQLKSQQIAPTYCRHNRPHPHIHSHLQLLLASAEKSTDCTYLLQAQQTTPPSRLQLLLASAERTTGAPTYCRHNKPHPLGPPPTALGISWKDTGAPTYCRHNRPHLHIPSHHQLLLTSAERTQVHLPTAGTTDHTSIFPFTVNCSWHQLKGQQVHLSTAGTTDHTFIFPPTTNCSWHQLKGQQVHLPTAGTTNHTPFPPPTALGISWKDNRCTYLLQAQQTTTPWPAFNCSWHQLKGHRCTYLLQAQQTTPPYSLPPPTALDISWKDNRCTYLLQAQQTTPPSRLQLFLASAERTTGAPTYCRHNKPHPLGPPPTALGISWKDTGAPTYCRHNRPHLHIPSHHQLLLTSAEKTTGAPTYCMHNKPHPLPASNCSWHQLKGQQVHLPIAGTTNHTPLARLQLLLASAERTQVHLPTAGTTDHTSIFPFTVNCSWHQLKGQQVHLSTAGTTDHTSIFPPTTNCSWH